MKVRRGLWLFIPLLAVFLLPQWCVAQEAPVPQGGCVALDKKNPPLFVSYERRDDKAWDGRNYVDGVLLKLNNNSNCVISFIAPPGYSGATPPTIGFKDGKLARLPDARIGSVKSGTTVGLYYLTKYPGEASLVLTGDFHVRETVYLNNGDYMLFSVPLKNFKRGGHVLVPFNYDWESGNDAYVVDTLGFLVEAVEHYLVFDPERLPPSVLK